MSSGRGFVFAVSKPPPFDVVLYTRPGCCLCDAVKPMLDNLRTIWAFELRVVNIDDDPDLQRRFCCQIPVVTINGGHRVALRITPERLHRAFERAARETGAGG